MRKDKKLKEMTKEEYAEYRHQVYMKYRESRLAKQHAYYLKHQEEIKQKQNKRYREKCGL
jgi:hypothetical protein